jgi:CRP/FNR family transcriptional regulator
MQDGRTAQRVARLRENPVFAELNDGELGAIVESFRVREYGRDEILFRQGDDSKEVYVILSGRVRIFKISPSGHETTIAIFGEQDLIGEMAALDGRTRSATAKTISPVTLLSMVQERFVQHAETMPKLAFGLARLLSLKLRWTASYAESIAQFDAAGRLLHILLAHNERYGQEIEPGKRYLIDLGLTQGDLASMVGARREWINRILSDWKRRGLLEFNKGSITILDLPRVVAERDSRIEANLRESDW